ncbi:MAG: SPASM domain-containing protein [Planctomycetes bacterium]|nr:SPASM domain-containing protein [Planctomycetota bacterium]
MLGPRAARRFTTVHRLNQIAAERAFERGEAHALHRPLAVFLQVASGCNLECYMCIELNRPEGTRRGRGLQSLSREVFEKLCVQVFPYSSRLHIGFGGEPTLSPDFRYYVERGFECGQQVDLTTNGTRIDQPGLAGVLARCVSYLQVSIDAATRETYERIRVGSRWSHLRANLELLNRHRLACPPSERTRLSLCFVLMKSNLDELVAFVELAASLQAEEVHAQHVIPTTDAGRPESLFDEPERYNRVREQAAQRARELGVHFDAPRPYPVAARAVAAAAEPAVETPTAEQAVAAQSAESVQHADAVQLAEAVQSADSAQPEAGGSPTSCSAHAHAGAGAARLVCKLPTQQLFISYEGLVMPCCHPHANVKMRAGDLRTEDFDAIWNNALFRGLRRALHTGDLHPICRSCSIVQDPPPAVEDVGMIRAAPTLVEWVAARPSEEPAAPEQRPLLEHLESTGILAHVEALDSELELARRHVANLEAERPHLLGHIANLESERPHLVGHIATLEAEREGLRRHAENLEHQRAALSARVDARARGWLWTLARRLGLA